MNRNIFRHAFRFASYAAIAIAVLHATAVPLFGEGNSNPTLSFAPAAPAPTRSHVPAGPGPTVSHVSGVPGANCDDAFSLVELSHYVNPLDVQRAEYRAKILPLLRDRYPRATKIKFLAAGGESLAYEISHDVGGRIDSLVVTVPKDPGNPRAVKMYEMQRDIIRAAERADHEGSKYIVDFYGTVTLGPEKIPGLVMKKAEGSLHDIIREFGPNTDRRTMLEAWRQMAMGLRALHAAGQMHRDLKPANILVYRDKQGKRTYKVADFGLSSVEYGFPPGLEASVSGTPAYMAPEQRKGGPGTKGNDMHSLAAICNEMLIGAPIDQLDPRKSANNAHVTDIDDHGRFTVLLETPRWVVATADPVLVELANRKFNDTSEFLMAVEAELKKP